MHRLMFQYLLMLFGWSFESQPDFERNFQCV